MRVCHNVLRIICKCVCTTSVLSYVDRTQGQQDGRPGWQRDRMPGGRGKNKPCEILRIEWAQYRIRENVKIIWISCVAIRGNHKRNVKTWKNSHSHAVYLIVTKCAHALAPCPIHKMETRSNSEQSELWYALDLAYCIWLAHVFGTYWVRRFQFPMDVNKTNLPAAL